MDCLEIEKFEALIKRLKKIIKELKISFKATVKTVSNQLKWWYVIIIIFFYMANDELVDFHCIICKQMIWKYYFV